MLSSQKSWLETEVARQVGENSRLENRLQLTLEGTGFGIWEYDLLTRHHRWSEGLRQLFGYAEEPATIDDYLALVHPEDRPLVEAQLLAPHSHGTPSTLAEFRLRHQDGRWHWVEARSRSLEHDANGQPRLIVGTLLDISARKAGEAERQLADLVFTGISDGICITDAQRKILRINKALTISPVTSRPMCLGRTRACLPRASMTTPSTATCGTSWTAMATGRARS